jgi:trehalose synthase
MSVAVAASGVVEIGLGEKPWELLAGELADGGWERLQAARLAAGALAGRTVWNLSSTARGGGVAEMLRTVLPYWRAGGVDARWLVIRTEPQYFRLTKRLHNMLHGAGTQRPLGLRDRALYERVARSLAPDVLDRVRPGDVVIVHDPQPAGLIPLLERSGAHVVWRCHVGADVPTDTTAEAWRFLLPYVAPAGIHLFTRDAFIPEVLDRSRTGVLSPAIDPCSPKNQAMEIAVADAVLRGCGLVHAEGRGAVAAREVPLAAGGHALMGRRCRVSREGDPPALEEARLVVALSRWDRLKDQIGIMRGFAGNVFDPRARLIVAGPAVTAVADDPEGREVQREVHAAWRALPWEARRRIDLAVLPMADLDENALIVRAAAARRGRRQEERARGIRPRRHGGPLEGAPGRRHARGRPS